MVPARSAIVLSPKAVSQSTSDASRRIIHVSEWANVVIAGIRFGE